jgi:hypothetical protein
MRFPLRLLTVFLCVCISRFILIIFSFIKVSRRKLKRNLQHFKDNTPQILSFSFEIKITTFCVAFLDNKQIKKQLKLTKYVCVCVGWLNIKDCANNRSDRAACDSTKTKQKLHVLSKQLLEKKLKTLKRIWRVFVNIWPIRLIWIWTTCGIKWRCKWKTKAKRVNWKSFKAFFPEHFKKRAKQERKDSRAHITNTSTNIVPISFFNQSTDAKQLWWPRLDSSFSSLCCLIK